MCRGIVSVHSHALNGTHQMTYLITPTLLMTYVLYICLAHFALLTKMNFVKCVCVNGGEIVAYTCSFSNCVLNCNKEGKITTF